MKHVVSITTFFLTREYECNFYSSRYSYWSDEYTKLKCAKLYFNSIINDSGIIQGYIVIAYMHIKISELI